METKQGDSKWIEVTWLEWPLHINVMSVINNLGVEHIQLPVHWSPLAWDTANSHGVASCEYHLTVVSPCVGLCGSLCEGAAELTLSSIKCVEAVAACSKLPDNSPSPLCWLSVLVWEAPRFLEQRFGSHSKWWQRQWWDRTRNPRGGSHFRGTRGLRSIHRTQEALIHSWRHCSNAATIEVPFTSVLMED